LVGDESATKHKTKKILWWFARASQERRLRVC
jgi:hypothetical protein